MEPKAIVIYDPDCGFCRFGLALLLIAQGKPRDGLAAAKGLRPLPLGTAEADRLLSDLIEEERNASWHVVLDEGGEAAAIRFSAGAALAPALSPLPGGRMPAALFTRFPRGTERAYRWVADHRGLLGRFVPSRARRWADRVIAAHGGPLSPQ